MPLKSVSANWNRFRGPREGKRIKSSVILHRSLRNLGRRQSRGNVLRTAIGVDSTSAISGIPGVSRDASGNFGDSILARWDGYTGIGTHYLQQLEFSEAGGTSTWYGDNGEPTNAQSGLIVSLRL